MMHIVQAPECNNNINAIKKKSGLAHHNTYRIVSPGLNDIGQIRTGVKEEVVAPFFKGDVQTVIFDIYPAKEGKQTMRCIETLMFEW